MNSILPKFLFLVFLFSNLSLRAELHQGTEPPLVDSPQADAARPAAVDCGTELGDVTVTLPTKEKGVVKRLHVKFNNETGGFSAYLENMRSGFIKDQSEYQNNYNRYPMGDNHKIHFDPFDGYLLVAKQDGKNYTKSKNSFKIYLKESYEAASSFSRRIKFTLGVFQDDLEAANSPKLNLAKRIISCMVRKLNF